MSIEARIPTISVFSTLRLHRSQIIGVYVFNVNAIVLLFHDQHAMLASKHSPRD